MPTPTTTSREQQHRTRAIVLIVAALILLVLAALLLAPALAPTEPIRRLAESRGEEALERPVAIGAVGIRLLPRPSLDLRDVRIGTNAEETADTLVEADRVRLHVSPLPLLSRRVVVTRAIVDGGTLTVERMPDGTLSVADLVDVPEPEVDPTWDVEIVALSFSDVGLVFIDRHVVPGETVTTRAHDVRGWLRLDQLGERVPLDVQLALFDETRRNVRIAGHLPMPTEEALDLDLAGAGGDAAAPPGPEVPSRPIDLHIVASQVPTAPLSPYLGDLAETTPDPMSVDLIVTGDLVATVHVEGAVEPWPGMPVTISGTVMPAADPPRVGLDFAFTGTSLARLLSEVPLLAEQLPQPVAATGHLDVRGRVAGTLDDLRATGWTEMDILRVATGALAGGPEAGGGLFVEANALRVAFTGRIQGDREPRIDVDVRARQLVLDFDPADEPPDAPPDFPDAVISARMQVAEGRVLLLSYEDLDARLSIEAGRMAFQPTLSAFEGEMRARVDSDMTRAPSRHRLQLDVSGVDADALAAGLTDLDETVSGRLSTALNVGWTGLDWEAFQQTATGEGSLHLEEGRIATLDVHPEIAQALIDVAVAIGVLPPEEIAEPTVGDIRAEFVIAEGRAHTEVLEIDGDFVRVLVSGSLGLDRSVDVAGSFAFAPAAAERFGPVGQVLRGEDGWLTVPFSVGGTVTEPEVGVDVGALIQRAATGVLGDPEGRWEALRRLWRERTAPAEPPAG